MNEPQDVTSRFILAFRYPNKVNGEAEGNSLEEELWWMDHEEMVDSMERME